MEVEAVKSPAAGAITLIRIEPEPTAPELLVYSNSVLLAVIGNQSFATLNVPAGTNVLTLDWEDTPIKFDEEVVLDTTQSTNLYLSVRHRFDVPEIARQQKRIDYTQEETLLLFEVPEKMAQKLLDNLDPESSYVFGSDD